MSSLSLPSIKTFFLRCDNRLLYNYASHFILQFALLGYTDVAARLLATLNNHDFYQDPHNRLKALCFLWDTREKKDGVHWPDGEEEKVRVAARKRRKSKKSEDTGSDDTITADDIERELTLVAKEFASKWYYPGKLPGSDRVVSLNPHKHGYQPTIEQKLDAARDIIRSFETADSPPSIDNIRSGLTSALDLVLSAQDDFQEQGGGGKLGMRGVPTPKELLCWRAKTMADEYFNQRSLADSRHAWEVLKTGALRQFLSTDQEALIGFVEEVESAITERLMNGRERTTAGLSIEELLKAVEHNTQTHPNAAGIPDQPRDASLFKEPAKDQQIAGVESRLNITLPSDYKTFLRLSNGFGAAWGHPLGDYEPPLHPLSSLRWLDPSEEDYFTDLPLDVPRRWDTWPFAPAPTAVSNYTDDLEHFLVGRALEIGTEGIDNTWLLPPSTMQPIKDAVKGMLMDEQLGERQKQSVRVAIQDFAGSERDWEEMEWGCVTWAAGGTAAMEVFPSFKAYLEDVVVNGRVMDEEEKRTRNVLQNGAWLGSLFRRDGGPEGPEWLEDAIHNALPPH